MPRLLKQHRLDLLFSPHYSLPPARGIPSIVTIHDLSFEHLPEEFRWKERWRRRILARRATRQANRVLADTEQIADELRRTYRLDRDRVGVVPLAIEPAFLDAGVGPKQPDVERLAESGIRAPYLLYAGTMLDRRHIGLLVEVFRELADERPDLTLVLAGANRLRNPGDLDAWLATLPQGRAVVPGYVPEELLPALYRNAALSFYLSPYEGFGLPPMESLACGTPAIVAPGLGLDGIWPDYPYKCAELDLPTVAAVTRRALLDRQERDRVGAEGHRRIAALTWEASARQFLGEVDRALAS